MSKELNLLETSVTEQNNIAATPEMIQIDDLSLTLVGGGQCIVQL